LFGRLAQLDTQRLSTPILAYLTASQIPLALVAFVAGVQIAWARLKAAAQPLQARRRRTS
jgi:hypothetical protein